MFDEGLVGLDAPIERFLHGVATENYDGTSSSCGNCLTTPRASGPADAKIEPDGRFDLAALVRTAMDDRPVSTPGAYHYSESASWHSAC